MDTDEGKTTMALSQSVEKTYKLGYSKLGCIAIITFIVITFYHL